MADKLSNLTFNDLKQEVRELGQHFPKFNPDDLFVLWFLRAYVTDNLQKAAEAITGGSKDKGVDALFVDDAARVIFIVQGKYRQKLDETSEGRSEVMAFGDLADFLHKWDDEQSQVFLDEADVAVAERLILARKKVKSGNYRSWLYFVTTGKVSPSVRNDVQQKVKKAGDLSRIEVMDGKRAMLLFRDYLDGVAPPIPTIDLEMESGAGIKVNGVSQRLDHNTQIESWVFSMRGNAVAAIYEQFGRRLFARNIRGDLGRKTPVNRDMIETLKKEPFNFFYYNNGITIVCDVAERTSSHGTDVLKVGNPQIINGQQTTRTLASLASLAAKASVLVKVIRVPRNLDENGDKFEDLVSQIVQGTNWQNAIKQSDLMSNDRRQIDLERELRKFGYFYLRKRQSKSEATAMIGKGQFIIIRKEEFAQASAGCELDPYIIRSGLENLFHEDRYPQVFPNSDASYFLPRYWLMREVTWAGKGIPERGYAKWLVLNFMWSQVKQLLGTKLKGRSFWRACEKKSDEVVVPLNGAINQTYVEAIKYWKANRGVGAKALDISTFFKNQKGHHNNFEGHWHSLETPRRTAFEKLMTKVDDAILSFDA